MPHPATAARLRSPTRQAVVFGPNFTGAGIRPSAAQRQIVTVDTPCRAATTGTRTCALSGSESKDASAGSIVAADGWGVLVATTGSLSIDELSE
jgi:hypothetical protein